ncbi:predicted protein [Scheffersomyces stipitis CBS 6054]|uniref:J domain-containing protein n=1 Tax=Scheffersomyces stipitis (strain ATCC 58785 / CBS 6054 / NBRC 10063 / NRRL Y-11545) TaxID=322104 RepID=A3LT04_PICST|nr:predicted protein [Scheffersomyces stipitis CBS 6054]ABN66324.1 predicted protein [Scheffersomyces stipitis CBS 6054]KAG2732952.1 hypothetical protein G9P44_003942 [Scheffersomyces stipitis]
MAKYRFSTAPTYTEEQQQLVLRILGYDSMEYYQMLGVDRYSTADDISSCYRRLAAQVHPDRNSHPQATDAFKQLNEAWEVLREPSSRTIYNSQLEHDFSEDSMNSSFSIDTSIGSESDLGKKPSDDIGSMFWKLVLMGLVDR